MNLSIELTFKQRPTSRPIRRAGALLDCRDVVVDSYDAVYDDAVDEVNVVVLCSEGPN